jgi:DNA-binding SARP family transcriptional activator
MLALEAGRVVPTWRLVDGVWGDPAPETATTALQGHISQLRRVLGEEAIVTRAPGYLLAVEPGCVDVARAERALADGDAAAIAQALDEWRGEPLADIAEAPFAHEALPRLQELRAALEEEHFETELALGRHAESVAGLRALVVEHPLRERPRVLLMTALHRAGRTAEALDVYADARRVLAEELGLDPGERLRALHEGILRQEQEIPPSPRGPIALPSGTPRRGRMWAAAIALAALTAGAVAVARSGDETRTPAVRSGLVRIDPDAMRASHTIAMPGTPSEVTAAAGQAWVLDADTQTISLVSGARQRTFATGSTPVDLAAVGTDLWVAGGSPGTSQFRGPRVRALARVDGGSGAVRDSIALTADRAAAPATDPHARVAVGYPRRRRGGAGGRAQWPRRPCAARAGARGRGRPRRRVGADG